MATTTPTTSEPDYCKFFNVSGVLLNVMMAGWRKSYRQQAYLVPCEARVVETPALLLTLFPDSHLTTSFAVLERFFALIDLCWLLLDKRRLIKSDKLAPIAIPRPNKRARGRRVDGELLDRIKAEVNGRIRATFEQGGDYRVFLNRYEFESCCLLAMVAQCRRDPVDLPRMIEHYSTTQDVATNLERYPPDLVHTLQEHCDHYNKIFVTLFQPDDEQHLEETVTEKGQGDCQGGGGGGEQLG